MSRSNFGAIPNSWALISKQVETADNRAAIMARITDVMLKVACAVERSRNHSQWREGILSAKADSSNETSSPLTTERVMYYIVM